MVTFVLPDRMLSCLSLTLAQGWFMPEGRSNHAPGVDFTMNFINGVTVFFFVGIIATMLCLIVKYRRADAHQQAASQLSHSTGLEMSWTLPPVFIVAYIFYRGFIGFMDFTTIPNDTYDITVTGQKWAWNFTHPNGTIDENLHVPQGENVKLILQSKDVIHSVYIPAFRVKKDAVPGRYNTLWFNANSETPGAAEYDKALASKAPKQEREALAKKAVDGGYILYCTEFCGTNHSMMARRVVVHPKGWRAPTEDLSLLSPAERGQRLFGLKGCAGCHQINKGQPQLVGPTFSDGIFGAAKDMADGTKVAVDDAYLAESIKNPLAKVVKGFLPAMPVLGLSDEEIKDVTAYIKSFK